MSDKPNEVPAQPVSLEPFKVSGELEMLRKLACQPHAPNDHMTACDRTMGDSHPCTCHANEARAFLRALRSPSPLRGAALGGPDVEHSETCETSDAQLDQYVALLDEILGMNSRFTEVKRLRDFVRSLRRPSDLTRAEPHVAPLPKEPVALGAQMVEALPDRTRVENEWTLPYEFIDAIYEGMRSEEFTACMEAIESVLLVYEKITGKALVIPDLETLRTIARGK